MSCVDGLSRRPHSSAPKIHACFVLGTPICLGFARRALPPPINPPPLVERCHFLRELAPPLAWLTGIALPRAAKKLSS
jgi:hypothetical protein